MLYECFLIAYLFIIHFLTIVSEDQKLKHQIFSSFINNILLKQSVVKSPVNDWLILQFSEKDFLSYKFSKILVKHKYFLYFICLFQFKVQRYITSLQEKKKRYVTQQSIL